MNSKIAFFALSLAVAIFGLMPSLSQASSGTASSGAASCCAQQADCCAPGAACCE